MDAERLAARTDPAAGCAGRPFGSPSNSPVLAAALGVGTRVRGTTRRLHPAPPGAAGRAAARGGRRLDRCRQVHAGELPARACRVRAGRDPSDHPFARAGPPPRRRRVVRLRSRSCPAWPAARARPTTPARCSVVAEPTLPGGLAILDAPDVDSVVAENRALAAPTAGGRRPVAVRHLGRPLRRRGALGLPALCRRAASGGGGRARPGAACGDGRSAGAPGADDGPAGARQLAAVRRAGDRSRR